MLLTDLDGTYTRLNHAFVFQVDLVTSENDDNARARLTLKFFDPSLCSVEGFL